MENETRKLRSLITLCWFVLFTLYLICICSGEYLEIIITEDPLVQVFNYIDNNLWLDLILRFVVYYFNFIFIYYAILDKKLYSYKPILLSLIIAVFWTIKTVFIQFSFINYIDFLTIGILIIFMPKKWYRVIIGDILVFIFTLLSSLIKDISIFNYNNLMMQSISINYMFTIDVILMSIIYYLYSRKEDKFYYEFLCIFRQRKEVENHKYSFRNFTCWCHHYYHSFISNLRRYYCLFLFSFIVYGSILIVGIIFNRVIEITISIVAFHIFRRYDDVTFHASTHIKCFCISLLTFLVVMKLSLPLNQSILFQIFSGYVLSKIMYFVQDYLDKKILVNYYKEQLENISTNSLEDLTEEEMIKYMPKIRKDIIHIVYGYLHRPNTITGQAYALQNNICEATLYRYLKLVKTTYENLTKN